MLERIVREFHANLVILPILAEGPTPAYDADVISHGKAEGNAPRWQATTESECLRIYIDANHTVRKMLKRPRGRGDVGRHKVAVIAAFRLNVAHELSSAALDVYSDANRDVRQVIERFKRHRAPELTANSRNLWIIWAGEGRRVDEVARDYGVSEDLVRNLRRAAGKEMNRGLPHKGFGGRPRKVER
jgi:hypothetical protein